MVGKEIAVKKYVVRLSAAEHAQLDELIRKGKRSAQLLTKARILLKADVSELGEGWSDSRIAAALDTSIATIERTRRQLVEDGFEAVLRRTYNPNSARPRLFRRVQRVAHPQQVRHRSVAPGQAAGRDGPSARDRGLARDPDAAAASAHESSGCRSAQLSASDQYQVGSGARQLGCSRLACALTQ